MRKLLLGLLVGGITWAGAQRGAVEAPAQPSATFRVGTKLMLRSVASPPP